jgi:phage-related protein
MRLGLTIAAALTLVCGAVSPLGAQQKAAVAPRKPPTPPKRSQPNPAKELDRFAKMPPEQQQKELDKLPPARRAAMEQRLARYEKLSPEQQEHFKQRLEMMRSLPKERQNAVREKIQELRALPPGERRKALKSDELQQNFSPDEQQLVREAFPNMKLD